MNKGDSGGHKDSMHKDSLYVTLTGGKGSILSEVEAGSEYLQNPSANAMRVSQSSSVMSS